MKILLIGVGQKSMSENLDDILSECDDRKYKRDRDDLIRQIRIKKAIGEPYSKLQKQLIKITNERLKS